MNIMKNVQVFYVYALLSVVILNTEKQNDARFIIKRQIIFNLRCKDDITDIHSNIASFQYFINNLAANARGIDFQSILNKIKLHGHR